MSKKEVVIRPASTIMLLYQDAHQENHVLLLKRNPELKFAAGFWVFPGGSIDQNELSGSESMLHAAKIAAVRETKEETQMDVAIDRLHHYVHWTTPKGGNRRFATWFFYTWVDTQDVTVDQSEIIDYRWLPLKDALKTISDENLPILPPLYVSIKRIDQCSTKTEINQVLLNGVPIVAPRTKFVDSTFYSFYKGDTAYNNLNEHASGPRHRISGNIKSGNYEFEYQGCDHIMPVTGYIK